MISNTSLTQHSNPNLVQLSRFINSKVVSIEFNANISAHQLITYFQITDEEFYQIRTRKPKQHPLTKD